MPEFIVAGETRTETGKNVNRRLRQRELIPAVVYGAGEATVAISVAPTEIIKILKSPTGENTLFDVEVDGKRRTVILKDYQVQPVTGRLLHADFYEVALDKTIEVDVHIELVGTPVGVKLQGGILDFITREIEIECLPADIPEKVVVDVSELELGKHVRVSQIELPPRVKLLTDVDVVIAHVVAPRAEEEAAPAEGEVAEAAEGAEAASEAAEADAEKPEEK